MSWKCGRCGKTNTDDWSNSCSHCGGWNANHGRYPDWKCSNCSFGNRGAYKTCYRCGARRPF
jgi:DNA-directed RNA polymerase subunit RPC12/RpoP